MEIIILGSGTYMPSKKRNSAGYLFRIKDKNLVFDFGSGMLKSLLNFDVDYNDIDYIFLTHNHPDHISDLIPLFHVCKSNRKSELNIFGFKGVKKFIEGIFQAIPSTKPKDYKINFTEMENSTLDLEGIKITSKTVEHKKDLNSVGFRIEAEDKVVVYSGDTDVCDNLAALAKDADLLIAECYCPDRVKKEGHLTPAEAGEVAARAKIKKLILSHLAPDCDENYLLSQVQKEFSGEVVVAEDLMKVKM